MADHLIDIFDENYNFVGTELKSIAHQKKDMWHQVFTCIIINSKNNKVFFQKKTPHKYEFDRPDYIDITVGGHLVAGEKIEDGIREIKEETGFDLKFSDLISLGVRQNTFSAKNKYYAYEYQHIFLSDINCKLEDFKIDEEEVNGFLEVDIDELIQLLLKFKNTIQSNYCYLKKGELAIQIYELSRKDIIPSYLKGDLVLLRIAIAAKRYCKGEQQNLLFW